MSSEDLKSKTCIPCQGGVPSLPLEEINKFIKHLHSDWKLTHDNTRIIRSFKFKNFALSIKLANILGDIAEEQFHHPELYVGWGHLEVEIWTHKINGLVESDFIYAAKVDEAYKNFEH
jgi:4a-hydroxytetrahydrobiopterin dehydratase